MSSDGIGVPAKFGTVLGMGPGDVPVYSSDYSSADNKQLPNRAAYRSYVDGVFMGYKWQCVELARRWLYLNKGYIFDDVAMAYDIFRLRSVRVVKDGTLLPLKSFRNGSRRLPEPGCLLIWNEGGEFDITGHVAVVTEVFPDRLHCIEQNVENLVWPEGQAYSRALHVTRSSDGGYWVECSIGEAGILGWVIQTDDGTGAEEIVDLDKRLFNLQLRELPRRVKAAAKAWLDRNQPDEAAYIDMMGGCKLSGNDADRSRYYGISESAYAELKRATNELHAMFLRATQYVLQDDEALRKFKIPPILWPRIRTSWENRRDAMITGRFDFSVSEKGIKAYEYNSDSASCHMECGKVQAKWAEHFGCTDGRGTGDHLHADLVAAWRRSGVNGVLHIMQDNDPEETYHALYMKSAAEKAGIPCKIIAGLGGLGWDDEGCIVDADGIQIHWVWKTWAWETAIDQIRAECAEDEENDRLHKLIDRRAAAPRLVDVLFHKAVEVFEPMWTVIPSNKAILPVLWMLFPRNRYLLDTQYALSEDLTQGGYVAKPIVGRCGDNIRFFEADRVVQETEGRFRDRDQIYQELFRLPKIDGHNVQVSTFSVGGKFGGACVRVDPSPIIRTNSDMLALRVIPDVDLLNAKAARSAPARKPRTLERA